MTPNPHERGQNEQLLRQMAAIVESADDAIVAQNWDGVITSWNRGAERLFGYSAEQAVGQSQAIFVPSEYTHELAEIGEKIRRGERVAPFETIRSARDGTQINVSVSVSPIRDETGAIVGMASIARDITPRKKAEAQVLRLAYFDPLTDLPNRLLFQDRLNQALALARRQIRLVAVHFFDLDHFKDINDSLGHAVGDALLKAVGERLKCSIRASDSVARLGGDEFAILQTDLAGKDGAATLAGRLIEITSKPIAIEQQEVRISASIGIAVFPSDGSRGDQLLQNADTAMYRAKQEGRNRYRFYSESQS